MRANAALTTVLALVMMGLGLALIIATIVQGGGQLGFLLGLLFLVAGGGRLYLARRT